MVASASILPREDTALKGKFLPSWNSYLVVVGGGREKQTIIKINKQIWKIEIRMGSGNWYGEN